MENSFAYLYDTTVVQETFDNQNLLILFPAPSIKH
ncbi:hypothetical protein KKC_13565 [Listeria fleischmannii subsp. coloradonensis]|nr:hypothetical protein KKC_13565 [Listeria fleischmannii subsp. coloradonensis]STY34546.1 Uncharacterised protein [Listeria fleischmannii subsp. coloradonensis]